MSQASSSSSQLHYCRWDFCVQTFDSALSLLHHVETQHVAFEQAVSVPYKRKRLAAGVYIVLERQSPLSKTLPIRPVNSQTTGGDVTTTTDANTTSEHPYPPSFPSQPPSLPADLAFAWSTEQQQHQNHHRHQRHAVDGHHSVDGVDAADLYLTFTPSPSSPQFPKNPNQHPQSAPKLSQPHSYIQPHLQKASDTSSWESTIPHNPISSPFVPPTQPALNSQYGNTQSPSLPQSQSLESQTSAKSISISQLQPSYARHRTNLLGLPATPLQFGLPPPKAGPRRSDESESSRPSSAFSVGSNGKGESRRSVDGVGFSWGLGR